MVSEIVGLVSDLEEITTYTYTIRAKLGLGKWQGFTGSIMRYEQLPLSYFKDHVNDYFQHMEYNYLLIERIDSFGIDEDGNRHNLSAVIINETYFWLDKKEVVRDDEED